MQLHVITHKGYETLKEKAATELSNIPQPFKWMCVEQYSGEVNGNSVTESLASHQESRIPQTSPTKVFDNHIIKIMLDPILMTQEMGDRG